VHGNAGHFPEEVLGKPYDLRLMKRFSTYFRPYRFFIFLSFILILFVTVLELTLPYLTKIGIDRYIFPSVRRIEFRNVTGTYAEEFARRYTSVLIPGEREGTFFIHSEAVNRIHQEDLKALEKMGTLSDTRFYPAKKTPAVSQITTSYPGLFITSEEYVFIAYDDMAKLKRHDLISLRSGDMDGILSIFLIFLSILIGTFCFNFGQIYTVELIGQKIMHDLRMRVFSHLQNLSFSFFDNNPVGRLVTRATNDVENIHEMFTSIIINLFRDAFLMLGILVVLMKINWHLALLCLSLLPLIFILTVFFSYRARNAFREVRIKVAKINATLQENISGMKVVQLFRREKENYRRFTQINHENYLASMKQIVVFALFVPIVEIMSTVAVALVIWYGGGNVISGELSLGALVAFLTYLRMFFQPVRDVSEKYNILQSAMASLERIFLLLDNQSTRADRPGRRHRIGKVRGNIEFQNVFFAYTGEEWVLKDVSFSIKEGESVAIVGATGAGKTSIINLILRFYEIQKGKILLDGVDVRDLDASFLRSQIGMVMQDVFLFAGDIKGNIMLGNDQFSQEELERVANYVNASHFIEKLPRKYDEEVREGGATLSAGERQLLAFARALAVNPKILILDEATSNIDTETERLIQDALVKLMKRRTSLVIAHRFSTIQNADRIIVIHHGRIREEGTHAELLVKRGLYYKLYQLQYQ
jgi:ATP-binding cassette subfamily B protein/subfamily B ATP-binding cassette protein MsbA